MDILTIFQSFQTQEQAIEYLEAVRWCGKPICPYCGKETVCRHVSADRAGQRWQCWSCKRAFAVTVGTIFHGTHIPLRSWFMLLGLMLNAKKSSSACQIARDLSIRRATVWSMMHRVRMAMVKDPAQKALLFGIVEADETYIGGKPRKGNHHKNGPHAKRGRGTLKTPVVGIAERNGRVIARMVAARDLTSKGLTRFIRRFVDTKASVLMTDEYAGYVGTTKMMSHFSVNHQVQYADGIVHTNTIEGFWSLVKRAWYGQHHHYSRKYTPLYLAEACFKYNRRAVGDTFSAAVGIMVGAK
jgi:transposase-like protein